MENKLLSVYGKVAKWTLYLLMGVVILSMLLGSIHLCLVFIQNIQEPDPYPFTLDVNKLFDIFSFILIIVVGYELFKSITFIIKSDKIPFKAILEIALIAVANKVITLDLYKVGANMLISLGVLLAGIGVAYFLFAKGEKAADQ